MQVLTMMFEGYEAQDYHRCIRKFRDCGLDVVLSL